MRSIPTACTKYYAQQNNITALGMYKKLHEGEAIEIHLLNEGSKIVCKSNKDHTVSNVIKLTRTTYHTPRT